MRLEESKINPLKDFLEWIPVDGVKLTNKSIPPIALFFNSGGVICETTEEVVHCLKILMEVSKLIEITPELLLRKVHNGN